MECTFLMPDIDGEERIASCFRRLCCGKIERSGWAELRYWRREKSLSAGVEFLSSSSKQLLYHSIIPACEAICGSVSRFSLLVTVVSRKTWTYTTLRLAILAKNFTVDNWVVSIAVNQRIRYKWQRSCSIKDFRVICNLSFSEWYWKIRVQ